MILKNLFPPLFLSILASCIIGQTDHDTLTIKNVITEDYIEYLTAKEAGWWEREVARDYFVGKDRDGAYCWLFMEEKGCFLHGYFS